MKKSAKLSLAITLMMGVTAGSQMAGMNTASAEVSDNFSMEVNGVTSYFHDTDKLYYGQTRTDNTRLGKGWNNYTRVVFNYKVDKDVSAHARLHSNYDNAGDFAANTNDKGAYFDQSYLQYDDKKSNMHYIVGKKGMTLGQSMVYNSTGNLTGAQVSYGNFWDPTCIQLTYGDAKGGNRVWSAQATQSLSKATSVNATYVHGESLYKVNNVYTPERDNFVDFGGKVKFHGLTVVGEYAQNNSNLTQHGILANDSAKKGWFIELYTGPTNDFGSGLPREKVGTHVFSVRYQDIGQYGTYVHNNTFYDDKKGFRFDYGMVIRKGLSFDFTYGRMQDKGTVTSKSDISQKGDWSNIFVASLNYKFR
jgi:hypothetical protein